MDHREGGLNHKLGQYPNHQTQNQSANRFQPDIEFSKKKKIVTGLPYICTSLINPNLLKQKNSKSGMIPGTPRTPTKSSMMFYKVFKTLKKIIFKSTRKSTMYKLNL